MATGTHHLWRSFSLFLDAVSLAAAIAVSVTSTQCMLAIISSGFWFLSAFWNTFVIVWERSKKASIHPGSVVAMDLLTAIYGIAMGVIGFMYVNTDLTYKNNDPEWLSQAANYNGEAAQYAVFATCVALSGLIHFYLFVVGCVHEDMSLKRIKAWKRAGANDQEHQYEATAAKDKLGEDDDSTFGSESSCVTTTSPPRYSSVVNKQAFLGHQEAELGSDRQSHKQASLECQEAGFGSEKGRHSYLDEKARKL